MKASGGAGAEVSLSISKRLLECRVCSTCIGEGACKLVEIKVRGRDVEQRAQRARNAESFLFPSVVFRHQAAVEHYAGG
jgi:hypothetical protein